MNPNSEPGDERRSVNADLYSRLDGMELHSILTCPKCGYAERLEMPTNVCVFFHECAGCHVLLKPKPGDCCVFCSYGSVRCPPVQAGDDCCAPGEPA